MAEKVERETEDPPTSMEKMDSEIKAGEDLTVKTGSSIIGPSTEKKGSKTPKTPTERMKDFGQALSPEKLKKMGMDTLERAAIVIPKVPPIPWYIFIFLSIKVALPVVTYILLFTTMGFGEQCFSYLADRYGEHAYTIGGATTGLIAVLYLFDVTDWDSPGGVKLAKFLYLLISASFVCLILFMTNLHPYGPIAFFAFITPIWLIALKGAFFSYIDARTYISWLSGPLFFVSVLTGVLWMAWTFIHDDNEWNDITRFTYADEAGCIPDFDEFPECESPTNPGEICVAYTKGIFQFETASPTAAPGASSTFIKSATGSSDDEVCPRSCNQMFHECLNTFILWIGPLMASMVLFFLSFFATFLKSDQGEKDLVNFGKLWIFLLFTVWVTSSLAGVAAGVASALFALTLASFVGSGMFISAAVSYSDQRTYLKGLWSRIVDKYGGWLNIVKGLAVALLIPVWFMYLVVSYVNQTVRRFGLRPSKKIKTDEERADRYTRATRRHIMECRSWNLSSVFVIAVYWAGGLFIMNVVVAKFTVLFLSWLIATTAPLGLAATTGIMIFVGIVMFLLPPVPGPPIYLTAGIVLLAAGRPVLGITGAIIYGCAISFLLKLMACGMQQKAIGERLEKFVGIRKAVGINSRLIKCSRLILMDRGFTPAKVGLLCGGPDWPTSVFCGILKLDLFPILLGTFPVGIIIIFFVMTGAFTYMASLEIDGEPEFPFAPIIGTIMAALASLVQVAAMVVAAYYLELTFNTRKEEIDQIKDDEEVKDIEQKEETFNDCYTRASEWYQLPLLPKVLLKLSLFFMVGCLYLVQLFGKDCFAPYQLTYTIEEHLDGDWTNLVLPLGQIACLLFLVSCIFLYGYKKWVTNAAKKLLESETGDEEQAPPLDAPQDEKSVSRQDSPPDENNLDA